MPIFIADILLLTGLFLWFIRLWPVRNFKSDDFRIPLNENHRQSASLPRVSIIVPARNEERFIEQCLHTLLRQDYNNIEVILVDDQSSDRTGEMADRLAQQDDRLRVIQGTDTPEGWFGKPWAVQQGVNVASGEYLLFTDADVFHEPTALRRSMDYAQQENLDFLSLIPSVECPTFWERLLLPAFSFLLGTRYRLDKANDPASPIALAAGGFILVRHNSYNQFHGHQSVRGEVIEDVALARQSKRAGLKTRTLLSNGLCRTSLGDNFGDLWEGLRKHGYAGLEFKLSRFAANLAFTGIAILAPAVLFPITLYLLIMGSASAGLWIPAFLSGVVVAVPCFIYYRMNREFNIPAGCIVLAPLGFALYQIIAAHAVWDHHVRKRISWKGRANRVRG